MNNPSDELHHDLLSAERANEQKDLITSLRQLYHSQPDLSQDEHNHILARVRERLLQKELLTNVETPLHPLENANSPSSSRSSASLLSPRKRRFIETINILAAVLIVGILIGGSLLLFTRQRPATSLGDFPLTSIVTSANNLKMSMKLTSGPYFLSEMLAVDLSLSNYSLSTYYVSYPFIDSICGYTSGIVATEGNKPTYEISIPLDHRCIMGADKPIPLRPGQTLTTHKFFPLTSSGKQTLMAEVAFYKDNNSVGVRPLNPGPLDQHWPTMTIDVSPLIPSNRQLSFEVKDPFIVVTAPTGVPSHMAYLYGTSCRGSNGIGISGNYRWEPISSNIVDKPNDCTAQERLERWDFAFGVPGYAIISGHYSPS